MKVLWRLALAILALAILLLGLETSYFAWVLSGDKKLRRADLIVVFEGRGERAVEAYRLLNQSFAPTLAISPATEKQLQFYDKKFAPARDFVRIVEEQSRTTLENAVYTRKLIDLHGFTSVILITSWDHMPRAYFLMKAMSLNSGLQIQRRMVSTGSLNQANWYRHRAGWQMFYNEMVEFWGSLLEWGRYLASGDLPENPPGHTTLANHLKQILLFEVNPP